MSRTIWVNKTAIAIYRPKVHSEHTDAQSNRIGSATSSQCRTCRRNQGRPS